MHLYQGYNHKPYGAGTRQPSRADLERRYSEAHASRAEPKPQHDHLPFMFAAVSAAVAVICTVAWAFGYDLLVPMLACIIIQLGLIVNKVME
jgi:hypothetical protein